MKAKILIVDDDQFILDMYMLKFKNEGYDAESAMDGVETLRKSKENSPDVILLDIVLPHMDGFEILQKLKEQGALERSKVIMLTNVGEKKDVEKGLALGAVDYIVKAHFTPSEVVKKVEEVLQK